MKRILHFADLHLDRASAGNGMTASEARACDEAQRATLSRIVDLALALDVDALTVGGDLYEQERVTRDTGRFIAGQFERLASTPVLIAPGNHDPYVPDSLYRCLSWPPNVHIFQSTTWTPVTLSSEITVWGVGHDQPGLQENVLRRLRLDRSRKDIALFHGWDLAVAPEREVAYCPFRMSDVERSGAAFVLLGHYHQMRLWPADTPQYGYPGDPQPLTSDAEAQGYVLLLSVDGAAPSVEPLEISEG